MGRKRSVTFLARSTAPSLILNLPWTDRLQSTGRKQRFATHRIAPRHHETKMANAATPATSNGRVRELER
jgi:hypothetical protein